MTIRVVVADDHAMIREGLISLLQREADIEVLAQARDGMELYKVVHAVRPDMAILDIGMPTLSGIEVIRRLRADEVACKLLCLSVNNQREDVIAALDAGASGYVLKENSYEELTRAIRRVMVNQIYLSGELLGGVLDARRQSARMDDIARPCVLTSRERQIAKLFAEGHSTKAIARMLFLSDKTIASHRENTFRKLNIRSIAELTRYAIREGFTQ